MQKQASLSVTRCLLKQIWSHWQNIIIRLRTRGRILWNVLKHILIFLVWLKLSKNSYRNWIKGLWKLILVQKLKKGSHNNDLNTGHPKSELIWIDQLGIYQSNSFGPKELILVRYSDYNCFHFVVKIIIFRNVKMHFSRTKSRPNWLSPKKLLRPIWYSETL